MDHSYEEIRNVAIEILSGRQRTRTDVIRSSDDLERAIAGVIERPEDQGTFDRHHVPSLMGTDRQLFDEVFWDLFRQGIITPGWNESNRNLPFFRISHFGKRILENENTYFFHDLTSYTTLIQSNVPNINDVTLLYLQEAMQSFRSGCMLAAAVMLGVASEHSFLLMLEAAESNSAYGSYFTSAAKERTILQKFLKFKSALEKHVLPKLPAEIKEDLGIDFEGILSVIRNFRNDSGHPSGKILGREQTYVLLQMFVPYCKKVYQLIEFFKN
jgi:hypothetical protein